MLPYLSCTNRLRVLAALPVLALAMLSAYLSECLSTLAGTICGRQSLEAATAHEKDGE